MSTLDEGSDQSCTHLRVTELEKRMELIFTMLKEATEKADQDLERRLQGMNEFRLQMKDQAATFLTSQQYQSIHELLVERVRTLENVLANLQGRFWTLGVITSAVGGLLGTLLSLLLRLLIK